MHAPPGEHWEALGGFLDQCSVVAVAKVGGSWGMKAEEHRRARRDLPQIMAAAASGSGC